MRTTSTASLVTLVAVAASLSATVACSVATDDAPGASHEAPPAADRGSPATSGSLASPGAAGVTAFATVPTGVLCVVATVTGADTETVTAAVPTGATSATLSFGALSPGQITVSANAYNTACPGTGAPSWNAEPVQATVVEGVATQVPLTLRPVTQTSGGTSTFSLPAIAIATGPRTSYAVLSDGTVRAWGANEYGELGTGVAGASAYAPVVVPGVTNATQIAAGNGFACVIRTDSSVMCWGYDAWSFATAANTNNVIDAPTLSPGLYATQMSALGWNMAFIGTGVSNPIATIGGTPLCLSSTCYPGYTWSPLGSSSGISVAAGITSSTNGVVELCWVTEQGVAECSWSADNTVYAAPATHVSAGEETAGNNACAILENGNAQCWGGNTYGELGIGTTSASSASTLVANLHQVTAIAMSRGTIAASHVCAIANGGVVYCAGSNNFGQLGNETNTASTAFTSVENLPYDVTAIAAGQSHTCALDSQGTVHCWGTNDDGELGDGTITTRFAPVTVQPW